MSATDYLDELNWGTGEAEDETTLGTPRLDARQPPTQYHFAGLQVTRLVQLAMAMTTNFKGGVRLGVAPQSSTPYGAGESGFWIDTGGNPKFTYLGVNHTLAGGGSTTLAGVYVAGGASSDSTITLNATNGPVVVQDASSTIGPAQSLMRIGSNGLATVFYDFTYNGSALFSRAAADTTADPIGGANAAPVLTLEQATASSGGTTRRWSPAIRWRCRAWDTGSSADRDHYWAAFLRPTSGNPTHFELVHASRFNGGNYAEVWRSRVGSTAAASWSFMSATPKFYSEATTGAQPAFVYDSANSYAATENLLELRNAGNKAFGIRPATTGARFQSYNSSSGSAISYAELVATGLQIQAGLGVVPETSVASGATMRSATKIWRQSWARENAGVVQTVSFSTTPSFDTSLGESAYISLSGNVSAWAITAGLPGQIFTIFWQQDVGGSRTLSAPPSNVKLQGGGFTLSTTGSVYDVLTLRYDSVNALWQEVGRSRYDGASTSTTWNTLYTNASSSASLISTLNATNGGYNIKDAASTVGSMFAGQTFGAGAPGNLWKFTGDTTHSMASNVADGASAVAFSFDTLNSVTNATALLASFRMGGAPKMEIGRAGKVFINAGQGIGTLAQTPTITCNTASFACNDDFSPTTDNGSGMQLGTSVLRWRQAWAMFYAGATEAVSASATPTFNPTLSGQMKTYTLAQNVTSWTVTDGNPDQQFTLVIQQDPATPRTWTTTLPANVIATGGVFPTISSTINKVDVFTFRWNGTTSKWMLTGYQLDIR